MDNNLLHSSQHGFRKKRSTQTALIKVTVDERLSNIDNGEVTASIFLDLAKAFDTVKHSILVRKLQALGVTGLDLDWFISYLDNRQQQVFFNGLLSSTEHILSGVPQGSALGPLLFLVYINDLPCCISHSTVNMFADDTALYYSCNNTDEILRRLNDDLKSISRWIKLNGLALNPKKYEYMVIGSPKRINYVKFGAFMLNGVAIKRVETLKYLGIVLDSNMSWSSHIDYLCNKVSSRIGILKRIMPWLALPSAQTVYKSTIQPLFDYCGVVWDTCSETSSLRLQRLQNRAGRVILLTDNCNPSASVRAKLNWSTLQQRRKYNKAILTYKFLNNQLEGLDTNYVRHSEVHSYNTRNKDKFFYLNQELNT